MILSKTAINKMNNDSNNNTQDSTEPRLPKNWQEFWEHFQVEANNQIKINSIKESAKILNSPFFGRIKNSL
ncbi:hypothetical protein, partial [uncultured Nostoc sp.]|uniref:hypothetical protein n=1 Tax=uncultured Nostoc sp. TaxID=340711 RepID=UPI0035C971A2